jgi:membrane protein implicated in regulation of membrane protease activity
VGASKEVSCEVEVGAVLTGIAEIEVPEMFAQYSLKILPVAVQAVVVELTVTETAAEVVMFPTLSVALAVIE